MIWPRNPARSSIAWMTIETVACTSAHGRIAVELAVRRASEPRDGRVTAVEPLVRAVRRARPGST